MSSADRPAMTDGDHKRQTKEQPRTSGDTLVEDAEANGATSTGEHHKKLVKADPQLGQAIEKLGAQVSQHDGDGNIYLKNSRDDPGAPRAFPTWKKYAIVGLASWLNNLGKTTRRLLVAGLC